MRRVALEAVPWVGFRVGPTALAVQAGLVRGVCWNEGLLRVPFARSSVAGVMVRGGRVVPVFDLGRAPAAWNRMPPPGGGQIVILGEGELEAGILADATETFRAGPQAGEGENGPRRGAPGDVREAILSGVLEANGRTYGVLSVPAVLHAAGVPKTFSG